MINGLSHYQGALEGVDGWDWDVFRLRNASGGRELQANLCTKIVFYFLCVI